MSMMLIKMIIYSILWLGITTISPRNQSDSVGLVVSLCIYIMTLILVALFDFNVEGLQFKCTIPLIPEYGLSLSLGIDGISLLFLVLTTGLIPICIFTAMAATQKSKELILAILLLELFLIVSFTSTNLFFFFTAFESTLIPMYLIIGLWGSRDRKIKAGYYFFLYTLFGSFFLLLGLLYLYAKTGSLDQLVLITTKFSRLEQIVLFVLFFIPFAIKLPMVPVHIWLPEAHVEAPTAGSMLLAGLLLKLGGYGMLRFTIPLFPEGVAFWRSGVILLACISIIYASLIAIRQSDLKRIIAYSSIAHMNFVVLGLFSLTLPGIAGALFLMIMHGILAPALFYGVNTLYERHHTRSIKDFSGLAVVMPLYAIFFFMYVIANMGFPGTANFNAEFLILIGVIQDNTFAACVMALGVILSAIYSIWLFNRVFFGTLKNEKETVKSYADIARAEFFVYITFLIPLVVLGITSNIFLDFVQLPAANIAEIINIKK